MISSVQVFLRGYGSPYVHICRGDKVYRHERVKQASMIRLARLCEKPDGQTWVSPHADGWGWVRTEKRGGE